MRKLLIFGLLPLVAGSLASCRVQKTEDGEAPDIDVDAGRLPQYDVDPARIEIGADTKKVVVPDLKVKIPKDSIR